VNAIEVDQAVGATFYAGSTVAIDVPVQARELKIAVMTIDRLL